MSASRRQARQTVRFDFLWTYPGRVDNRLWSTPTTAQPLPIASIPLSANTEAPMASIRAN